MSIAGKWGYTHSDEHYHGAFDSAEQAAAEGGSPGDSVQVGQYREPAPFSEAVDVDIRNLIESAYTHDDWCGDWAAPQIAPSKEQCNDLEVAIRECVKQWTERHGMTLSFGVVELSSIRTVTVPE